MVEFQHIRQIRFIPNIQHATYLDWDNLRPEFVYYLQQKRTDIELLESHLEDNSLDILLEPKMYSIYQATNTLNWCQYITLHLLLFD